MQLPWGIFSQGGCPLSADGKVRGGRTLGALSCSEVSKALSSRRVPRLPPPPSSGVLGWVLLALLGMHEKLSRPQQQRQRWQEFCYSA